MGFKEGKIHSKLKLIVIMEMRVVCSSERLKVVCSNEPLKLHYIKLENPFLFFHQSKEKYQEYTTIVQTYTPSNPYAHKANFAILLSWMSRLKISLSSRSYNSKPQPTLSLPWTQSRPHNNSLEEIFFQSLDIGLRSMGWSIAHWALDIIVILKK